MGLRLLQFNNLNWTIFQLDERCILLQNDGDLSFDLLFQSTELVSRLLKDQLEDIVPSYQSIALFTSLGTQEIMMRLEGQIAEKDIIRKKQSTIRTIPICYEYGLDTDRIAQCNGLTVDSVIDLHVSGSYRALFPGFMPGFVYAEGLSANLICPRLETPRTQISAGSVGIGGNQTGIYGLDGPGGWNIIGRVPIPLFLPESRPPLHVLPGDKFEFYRISKEEFDQWES
ncbi:MAG: allophanate hydrolase subunit 1 [Bacteroidota bacterium]